MPRLMVPILACAFGVGAAFALVSCGGSDNKGLLPGSTASEIVANIDKAQTALDEQDCDTVIGYANSIQSQVEDLPATVEPKLRSALDKGAKRLLNLASNDNCGLTTESTTTTSTEESSTASTTADETSDTKNTTKSTPATTSTNTTPTNTTPTTVPTTPPPTTPTPPPTTPTPPGGGVGPGGAVGPGRTGGG